jgi:hypothetical protein
MKEATPVSNSITDPPPNDVAAQFAAYVAALDQVIPVKQNQNPWGPQTQSRLRLSPRELLRQCSELYTPVRPRERRRSDMVQTASRAAHPRWSDQRVRASSLMIGFLDPTGSSCASHRRRAPEGSRVPRGPGGIHKVGGRGAVVRAEGRSGRSRPSRPWGWNGLE